MAIKVRVNVTRNSEQAYIGEWREVKSGIFSERVVFEHEGFHEVGLHLLIGNQSLFLDYPISVHPANVSKEPVRMKTQYLLVLEFLAGVLIGYLLGKRAVKK